MKESGFLPKKAAPFPTESAMTTLCCLTHRAPFQNGKLKKPWVFRRTPLLLTGNTKDHLIYSRCFMTPGSYPHKLFIGKLDRGYFKATIEFSFSRAFVSNGGNSYNLVLPPCDSHKRRVAKDRARSVTISTKPESGDCSASCWGCDRRGKDIRPSHDGLLSAHSVLPPRGL